MKRLMYLILNCWMLLLLSCNRDDPSPTNTAEVPSGDQAKDWKVMEVWSDQRGDFPATGCYRRDLFFDVVSSHDFYYRSDDSRNDNAGTYEVVNGELVLSNAIFESRLKIVSKDEVVGSTGGISGVRLLGKGRFKVRPDGNGQFFIGERIGDSVILEAFVDRLK